MAKWILVTLVLSIACKTAMADEIVYPTAAEMASWCQPYKTAILDHGMLTVNATKESNICYGAFLLTQQLSITVLDANSTAAVLKTCLPESSRTTELIKVFIQYADRHPERGHEKFSDVLLASLWNAYPCGAPAKPK